MFVGLSSGRIDPKTFIERKGDIAIDSSENGNDGQINGAKWVDGKFGKALSFDGAVDEVAIYNVALGEEDIDVIMKGLATAVFPSGKLTTTWGQTKK
jgi:hypothetical protein